MATVVNKFGAGTVGTTYIAVSDLGVAYPYQSSAVALEAVSDDAADTQEVVLEGTGADGSEVTQTVTLTGLTPVAIPTALKRIYRFYNDGATDFAGTVTIQLSGGGTALASVAGADNQTLMAVYTVPAGKLARVARIYCSTAKGADATVKFRCALPGKVFRLQTRFSTFEGYAEKTYTPGMELRYTAGTDIELAARVAVGTGEVNAGFDMILEDA